MPKNPEHRDIFPGALELMILHSLRVRPMHGYALVKHIRESSDNVLHAEEGSIYPALQRMLKEELVASEEGLSAKGRPTRIYSLTDAGKKKLKKELAAFEQMYMGISRVLSVVR